jgi:ribonuclease P protein subunit RPR2
MYSSISGVILRESVFSGIEEKWPQDIEIAFISCLTTGKAVRRRKDNRKARDLAVQRMDRLFMLATAAHEAHPERSDRYVQIARKISTRTRVRMPRSLKRLFCRHCGSFLSPAGTRVRLREGVLTTTCLLCGEQSRRPYWAAKS